jgi:transcriptional antiterminator RfaH
MSAARTQQWFAFSTRIKHEKKVNAKIQSAGIESYLPLQKTQNTWKDRKKWIESPLFPSYIFTKIVFNRRYEVLSIPSVIDIVGFNNQPSPVRPDEIEAIKTLLDIQSQYNVISGLSTGNRVRICSGPLEGFEARVTQVRGNEKLVINISAIGKSIVINATDYKIEKI